jgi:putative DNA primase/helicase
MALDQVASEHRYNPVAEYLRSLSWDGTERISAVAEDILGIGPDELTQAMLRKWFISAVARPLNPGCKVDTVLILQGPQGVLKSTFFSTLAGAWFSDSPVDIQNKDALMLLRRVWILEWAELDAMQRARDAAAVKAFVSSRVDSFRLPFGRRIVDAPRHCVIVGSTNDEDILGDSTGNRRYWIVQVHDRLDIPKLAAWRDQLWAEAVSLYRAGEAWWLAPEQERALARAQERFEKRDPWEEAIADWLARRATLAPLTTTEILDKALHKPEGSWTSGDARRAAALLRRLGWEARNTRHDGDRFRTWERMERTGTGAGDGIRSANS